MIHGRFILETRVMLAMVFLVGTSVDAKLTHSTYQLLSTPKAVKIFLLSELSAPDH